jgi:autotransporter-associated beta strand protein
LSEIRTRSANGSATNNLVIGSGYASKTSGFAGHGRQDRCDDPGGTGTIDTNGFDMTLSGVISGAGTVGPPAVAAGNLTKAGAGRLTLTGTNTYDGITTVDLGALRATSASSLGSATGNTVISGGGGVTNDAVLELDGTAGGFAVADQGPHRRQDLDRRRQLHPQRPQRGRQQLNCDHAIEHRRHLVQHRLRCRQAHDRHHHQRPHRQHPPIEPRRRR